MLLSVTTIFKKKKNFKKKTCILFFLSYSTIMSLRLSTLALRSQHQKATSAYSFVARSRLLHSTRLCQQQQQQKPLTTRLADSWNNTETKWYPIPVALGLSVIGFIQYRKVREREEQETHQQQKKYVASGPWQVIMDFF